MLNYCASSQTIKYISPKLAPMRCFTSHFTHHSPFKVECLDQQSTVGTMLFTESSSQSFRNLWGNCLSI